MNNWKKVFVIVCLTGLYSCSTISDVVLYDLRKDELHNVSDKYRLADDAYRLTLSKWPLLSVEGVQRRSLIYTLAKDSPSDLQKWSSLSPVESLKSELQLIRDLLNSNARSSQTSRLGR